MGQESLSVFPSERARGTKRPPLFVPTHVSANHVANHVDENDAPLRALFGAIETAPHVQPAPTPARAPAPPIKLSSGSRVGIALAATIILGLAGLAVLPPANSAPPETSVPSGDPVSPPLPLVQTATHQTSSAVQAPVVAPASIVATPPAVVPPPAVAPTAVKIAPRVAAQVGSRARASAIAPASAGAPAVVAARPIAGARAFAGTLIVDSVPQGATVLINQRNAGVTPLRLQNHPAGSYAVRVELNGFERSTAVVRVAAETTTRINPTLRLTPSAR